MVMKLEKCPLCKLYPECIQVFPEGNKPDSYWGVYCSNSKCYFSKNFTACDTNKDMAFNKWNDKVDFWNKILWKEE